MRVLVFIPEERHDYKIVLHAVIRKYLSRGINITLLLGPAVSKTGFLDLKDDLELYSVDDFCYSYSFRELGTLLWIIVRASQQAWRGYRIGGEKTILQRWWREATSIVLRIFKSTVTGQKTRPEPSLVSTGGLHVPAHKPARPLLSQTLKRVLDSIWQELRWYARVCASYLFLRTVNPKFVIALSYSTFDPLVVASRLRHIDAISLQHGDYYNEAWLDYYSRTVPFEWPSTRIMVWDRSAANFCRTVFGSEIQTHVVGPIWLARYWQASPDRTLKIVVYESESDGQDELLQALLLRFGPDQVAFKPHPWKYSHDSSLVHKNGALKKIVYETPTWEAIPKVGIVFGSTVGQELVYLSCPCIFITSTDGVCLGRNMMLPLTGRYSSGSINRILEEIERILADDQYCRDFAAQQFDEMNFAHLRSLNVPGSIVEASLLEAKGSEL